MRRLYRSYHAGPLQLWTWPRWRTFTLWINLGRYELVVLNHRRADDRRRPRVSLRRRVIVT